MRTSVFDLSPGLFDQDEFLLMSPDVLNIEGLEGTQLKLDPPGIRRTDLARMFAAIFPQGAVINLAAGRVQAAGKRQRVARARYFDKSC